MKCNKFLRVILCVLLLIFSAGLGAGEQGVPIDTLREAVYGQTMNQQEFSQEYESFLAKLEILDIPSQEKIFWQCQAAFYQARFYQNFQTINDFVDYYHKVRKGKFIVIQRLYPHLDLMVESYEKALYLAETYLEGTRDARGVRLYAETLSQLSTLKTTGYLIANGPKVEKLADEAIKLDGKDIRSYILKSSRYIYSPKFWGGNPQKGIDLMQGALEIGTAGITEKFDIYGGIAYAYAIEQNPERVQYWLQKAEKLYPENLFVQGMFHLLKEGTFGPFSPRLSAG